MTTALLTSVRDIAAETDGLATLCDVQWYEDQRSIDIARKDGSGVSLTIVDALNDEAIYGFMVSSDSGTSMTGVAESADEVRRLIHVWLMDKSA